MLAYYHYCNKAVYPFSPECKDQDLQSLAELDDNGLDFVRYTRRIVAEHSKFFSHSFTIQLVLIRDIQRKNGRSCGSQMPTKTSITMSASSTSKAGSPGPWFRMS